MSFWTASRDHWRSTAIPLTDSLLCCSLVIAEAPYPVEHSAACRCFLSTTCRYPTVNNWQCSTFFTQDICGPYLTMIIAFHFATPVHGLRTQVLVTTQQYLHDYGYLVVECYSNTTLSHYPIVIHKILQLIICRTAVNVPTVS
jgi:hypothetical protein